MERNNCTRKSSKHMYRDFDELPYHEKERVIKNHNDHVEAVRELKSKKRELKSKKKEIELLINGLSKSN